MRVERRRNRLQWIFHRFHHYTQHAVLAWVWRVGKLIKKRWLPVPRDDAQQDSSQWQRFVKHEKGHHHLYYYQPWRGCEEDVVFFGDFAQRSTHILHGARRFKVAREKATIRVLPKTKAKTPECVRLCQEDEATHKAESGRALYVISLQKTFLHTTHRGIVEYTWIHFNTEYTELRNDNATSNIFLCVWMCECVFWAET